MTDLTDRVRGGIYALAVGDALGATLEFMDREQIRARYGVLREVVGGGWLNLRPGEWTDDTEMTLAVAEGILVDPENPVPHIGETFLRWRTTNPPDIGGTIRAVFQAYDRLKDWYRAAEEVHARSGMTAGNGALMRTLPLAFAYPDAADLYMRCMEVARMTHWDPEAGLTCFIYCLTVQELWRYMTFAEAYGRALDVLKDIVPRGEMEDVASRLARRLGDVAGWPKDRLRPTGYTVDTLACALWCVANTDSFEEAVVEAVNLGGDADTVGAVTGGLAGVMYGYDAISARWLDKFDGKQLERLDNAVTGLVRFTKKFSD
ncbi:ADP-ribosylglycohydrolase family protein [Desulfofundulus thermobenzoicus]|nr:ADP-ribosylglycohydrolase family protein [Desulfofundulus thermobenzoicus]